MLALMLLALVLSAPSRPLAAGITLGIAAAIKQTAWPLIPFLVMATRDRNGQRAGGKALAGAGAVFVPVVLPFLVWGPRAFIEDTVLYPLGLTEEQTLATSPTIGRLLTEAFPSAKGALLVIVAPRCLPSPRFSCSADHRPALPRRPNELPSCSPSRCSWRRPGGSVISSTR